MIDTIGIVLPVLDNEKMKSDIPAHKHEVCGKPMYEWVRDALLEAGVDKVYTELCEIADGAAAIYIPELQKKNLGDVKNIITVMGNMPLISPDEIKNVLEFHGKDGSGCTSVMFDEENADIYVFSAEKLFSYESEDIFEIFEELKKSASVYKADDTGCLSVNDRVDLASAQMLMQNEICNRHMYNGVTIINPDVTYIDADVEVGIDSIIYPNVHLKGKTKIGSNVTVGANSIITDSVISDGVDILNSVITESYVESGTHIGPFAYLRPNSKIGKNVKIGDFVEIKNATLDEGTKVSHLTYVGDTDVGKRVNFGCGCVTVNYDGKNKFRSKIGDDAFIGCNTNLVSPVTVNDHAYIAAGSTITEEVPKDALAIARARQIIKTNWKDRRSEKK